MINRYADFARNNKADALSIGVEFRSLPVPAHDVRWRTIIKGVRARPGIRPGARCASPPVTPPTYRERLRTEGAVLAVVGAIASALLLALVARASERSASTIGQLIFVTILLLVLAPFAARRSIASAEPVALSASLTGEPTPLWKPPLVLLVLAAAFVVPGELGVGAAGWDAGLRITGGCLLVGLAQALLIERVVAADESRTGRRYVRLPGSRPLGGTKLGFIGGKQV